MTYNFRKDLSAEHLKQLFSYDPETGLFTRLVSRHRGKAGVIAGSVNRYGYRNIIVDYVQYKAHRLAFLYMAGSFPEDQIDHINGQRDDNRWANLRECNSLLNRHNVRAAMKGSKVSLLGVSIDQLGYGNKFIAEIRAMGKRYYLGRYATAEEAHAAYVEAKRRLHLGCTI